MVSNRTVIPVRDSFFNDGYWYVLSSSSLGGSGLSANDIGDRLQTQDPTIMQNLLQRGVCLPLYFPADCCLDHAVIILGDLNPIEEQEWIGRIQGRLEIPCGEFMMMGGGMAEDFEIALSNFEPPDPNFSFFQKIKLEPGTYLVEIYTFASSINTAMLWEEKGYTGEDINAWWQQSHPGAPLPLWLRIYLEQATPEDYDQEEDLVDYLIRLKPMDEEDKQLNLPALDPDVLWCGVYAMRQPEICPRGLKRSELFAEAAQTVP